MSWTKLCPLHPNFSAFAVVLRCCVSWTFLCSVASSKGISTASSQSKSSCVAKPGIFAQMAKQENPSQASPKTHSRQLHNSYSAAGHLVGWNEVMVHSVRVPFVEGIFPSSGLAGRMCAILQEILREKWEDYTGSPRSLFCLPWYEHLTL